MSAIEFSPFWQRVHPRLLTCFAAPVPFGDVMQPNHLTVSHFIADQGVSEVLPAKEK
jgi:hypothetical protein